MEINERDLKLLGFGNIYGKYVGTGIINLPMWVHNIYSVVDTVAFAANIILFPVAVAFVVNSAWDWWKDN